MATVLHLADDDNNNNINVKTNAGRENLTLYAYKKKISLRGSSLINFTDILYLITPARRHTARLSRRRML
jgi:hypothetical protein